MVRKKKINLYGVGNEKNFNFYIFDKDQKVFEILSEIFEEIFKVRWPKYLEYYDENDEPKQELKVVKNYTDIHEHLEKTAPLNKNPRIDVFYGGKRMFVIIHSNEKKRKEFNKKLYEISKMPSLTTKEINKLKNNKKNKIPITGK